MSKINVFLVDDSAVVRQVLSDVLGRDKQINILGVASDPIFAMKRMEQEWPDVIVLDVEMPRMDGITFLKKIMSDRPTPVVICSTLTEKGAETTMQALDAGAVSIITKPKVGLKDFLADSSNDIIQVVKAAGCANVSNLRSQTPRAVKPKLNADAILPKTTVNVENNRARYCDWHIDRGDAGFGVCAQCSTWWRTGHCCGTAYARKIYGLICEKARLFV